jgi:hypothetical protein
MLWDVFISHASEDKASVARPLGNQLEASGLRVWLDETQVKVGDSLRAKIDEGLAQSRFGIVIVSEAFLDKRWPQRELAGLFARPEQDVILPVWHGVSARDVAAVSPMLADIVAASTANGIEVVAAKILEKAAPYLRPSWRSAPRPYSTTLGFPADAVKRAMEVLESLAQPAIWRHLEITAADYPQKGWLGSTSSTLIEVLYGFAAPLYAARGLSYDALRNRALLDRSSRLRLALLDAALDAFIDEGLLALSAPAIRYSPRVPNWRLKRVEEPARYWWQGLSPDRFDELRSYFLKPGASDARSFDLVTVQEFHGIYQALSEPAYGKDHQALGLLGNGFFGFTPQTRPILWRIIVCQSRLYQAAMGNTQFDAENESPAHAIGVFVPKDDTVFPFRSPGVSDGDLYEPFADTMAACTSYLETFVVPRLKACLAADRET